MHLRANKRKTIVQSKKISSHSTGKYSSLSVSKMPYLDSFEIALSGESFDVALTSILAEIS